MQFTGLLLLSFRAKVDMLIVAGFIASLNVILTEVFVATPVAPLAGEVEVTVGDVVSGATPVVKVQE